ncbi:DMT family transporter [Agromyces sp. MMS24-K17]|uniref:DMT family transporter n=1 Tax=Agromyces sp. MMS24-K17 TaxID=3372850 RepID=UPI0037540286
MSSPNQRWSIRSNPRRQSPGRTRLLGGVALAIAVLLWSSFALTLRGAGGTSLTTIDVSMLRFLTPLVILAPFVPRAIRQVRREPVVVVLLLLVGGLPHFLVSALGGHLASAALVGLIIPGTVPVFVTLLALAGAGAGPGRRRVARRQLVAVAAILVGVGAAAALTASSGSLAGIGVLLAAGFIWAVYTLALRRTSLDVSSVVLVVCAPSAAIAVLLAVTGAMPSSLLAGTARPEDALLFVLLQGVGTGVVSTVAYVVAVRSLGSGIASAAGALSPVVTALLAVPLLGEPLTAGVVVALAIIVGGVALFNAPPRRARVRSSVGASAAAPAGLAPAR